jgi:predicted nucleic acid-binding Zn ribbon protein
LVFNYFPKYHMKCLFEDCNTQLERERERERIFSNRQLGMRVYIMIVMIMVSE